MPFGGWQVSALTAALVALSSAASAEPTAAECKAARDKPTMTGAEIMRMTPKQKEAAKPELEARIRILQECVKIDARKAVKAGQAAISQLKADCERRGQPKIGMTPAELIETCWRKPQRIVKITTASGIAEKYVYGTGHTVTIIDGKVSEILETR